MIITIVISILAFLFLLMTLMPFVRSDFWTFRVLEYPRLQKLSLGIGLMVACIVTRGSTGNWFPWIFAVLVVCNAYLIYKIFPYTVAYKKEMKRVRARNEEREIKIFTANVLQDNTAYNKMLQQINTVDPDIVFLLETNGAWEKGVRSLEQKYPYTLKAPLENTYGLLLYSRLKLHNASVRFIVDEEIPSIKADVELPNGRMVKLFGLHPKPPVPEEEEYSTAKDKELMKVAFEVEKIKDPCIVMGDLNDVAWSRVTELFRKVSGLLDPRRGRGFYSTFSANHWWMRFPLDYIFCSNHFGLVQMRRMPHNGSDHFAMFIHLQYVPQLKNVQEEPEADGAERKEAAEKAATPVP
jgi:endonuclease/exonuclease/phosphatase (EEP) superfamily protein YafD